MTTTRKTKEETLVTEEEMLQKCVANDYDIFCDSLVDILLLSACNNKTVSPFCFARGQDNMEFLHKVEAIVILDAEGNRVFAKYYPATPEAAQSGSAQLKRSDDAPPQSSWATPEKQVSMEAGIHSKARDPKRGSTADGDIMIYEGHTVLFYVEQELTFIVMGGGDENEMVLNAVLQCLVESLQQVLKLTTLDKRSVLEKYEVLLLIVDEMIDDGIILETSSSFIVGDVAPYEVESSADGARKALSTINKILKNNL